jgi:endoglucanase
LTPVGGSRLRVANRNSDVEQVFSDGFSHFVYVVAFDRLFTQECQLKRDYVPVCLDSDRVVAKFTSIKKQILETLIKYPDAVFVISPKPGYEIFYKGANDINQTYWHESFENNEEAREAFKNLWGLISKVLNDVPDENLAFNLLNEPEFEQMKAWNKREIWQQWATEIVDVIRDISPERTIIIEGIHKSLFAQNNGPANVIRPIPRKNIVYGFHYYQDEEWGRQDRDHLKGVSGVPLPSLNNLKSNMQQLVDYTKNYKVPVVLTEIGVNGPCDGNGPLQKDRATYSSVVYEMLVSNSIGITWWALETADGTPYQRISGDCYSDLYEKQLIPDKQLFKALRLTPITTEAKQPSKAVVDALQIILDNEEAEKKAKQHTVYDGRYPFTLSRYNEDEGSQRLGSGYIEINNGIMTVAKEGRTLDTGSIDLYDSFEGHIDKEGNIMSSLKINALTHKTYLFLVDLNGSIDSPLQGEWDHYFDVILKLGEKVKQHTEHTVYDGRYPFTLSRHHEDEGSKRLGNGYIEINNGIMTVAKEGRTLDTGSIDLYDSFEGQIDKKGNIVGSLKIGVLTGKSRLELVNLNGSINSQLQGEWDSYFDVILKLGHKE